jgi:hypothetical protein
MTHGLVCPDWARSGRRRARTVRSWQLRLGVRRVPTLCVLPLLKTVRDVLVRSDLVGGHDPELADGGVAWSGDHVGDAVGDVLGCEGLVVA